MQTPPDPDNPRLSDTELRHMKRTPQARIIRRTLKLTEEEFAGRYGIPVETLRDWEQDRTTPDLVAQAYLKVIASEPELARKALAKGHT